jgi:hypothetical protein
MARGAYIQAPEELSAVASQLLSQLRQQCQKTPFCCRLLGIRCSNLIEQESFANPQQRTMDKFLSSTTTRTGTSTTTFSPTPIKTTTSPYQSTKGMSSQSHKKRSTLSTTAITATTIRRALYPQNKETNKDPSITTSSQHKTPSTAKEDDSEKEERVECPLCKRPILAADNDALNRHIDTCLNASTVRQAVREASKVVVPSQKKRLTDFW